MNKDALFPAVACLQFPIVLGEVERNLAQVRNMLSAHPPAEDTLVLLPEIWATGFDYPRTMELGLRTPEILAAATEMAAAHRIFLAGSLTEAGPNGKAPRNTLFLVGPEGMLGSLSKQHLFRFWQEDRYYRCGESGPLLPTPFGPIGGLICYDLRFPEVARRQVFAGSRLLIVSAQWPLIRLDHWQTLLRARAIENQCYIAACNGCGVTGTMEMAGHSMIIGPDGQMLAQAGNAAALITAALDPAAVDAQRNRFFPAGERSWLHADSSKIRDLNHLLAELRLIRRHGNRVAFTNGCFDILHAGHVSYLEQARRTADCLVVGLNTDDSVRDLKGPGRPVNTENDRARVLAALGCVDYVVLFSEATPLRLITAIQPDVLVKGADYEEEQIVGAVEVKAAGGRVERIAFEHACSTTALIRTIQHQSCTSGLPREIRPSHGDLVMTTIRITGMKCQHCEQTAQKALEELGATDVRIDLTKGEAHYKGTLSKETIRQVMADKGFTLVD
jgi:rfaE bifunctional protein nucleotidyltransferase chain/domain